MLQARFFKKADIEECLKLFETNVGKYFAAEERDDYELFLLNDAEDHYYQVFEDDNKQILAVGGHGQLEQKTFLRWGMVNQHKHGTGFGKQLLLHRLKVIQEKVGEQSVYIDTSQHVQGFYQKYGFELVSTVKDGFAPNIDKVRLRFDNWPVIASVD